MDRRKTERYIANSDRYFENALNLVALGEPDKAGELLCGSMAQVIKAVAASRGETLKSHNQIERYASELARQLENELMWYAFDAAQHMHPEFYESGLTIEHVARSASIIRAASAILFDLIPRDGKEK